jgi:hypothetical protein
MGSISALFFGQLLLGFEDSSQVVDHSAGLAQLGFTVACRRGLPRRVGHVE